MNARDARLVIVTAGDERQAASIARTLVDERLAACVNMIGPIRSVYRWRDAVEDEREYLLLIKTRAALYKRIEARVAELHGYEVPEVLAITPSAGSARYLEWLGESVASLRRASTKAAPARTRARRRKRV